MNTFLNLTVTAPVVQSAAATAPTHLIRLQEAMALLAALFTGAWSNVTNYTAGLMAFDNGSLYVAKVPNTNLQPSLNPTQWGLAAAGGASSYVYIAYASDGGGTGFTTVFDVTKTYIAILTTTTELTPEVGDFAGLWFNYQGPAGTNGTNGGNGTNGTNGAAAFMYVAYASDANGTGFSLAPNINLLYVAFLAVTAVIVTPVAANFAGLWLPYKGAAGTNGTNGMNGTNGTNGAAGVNAYLYLGYASDANGTGFSLAPASNLGFIAAKATTVVIAAPAASDFIGLWRNCQGPPGVSGSVTSFIAAGFAVGTLGAYLKNATTGLWHLLSCTGTPVQFGLEQIGIASPT